MKSKSILDMNNRLRKRNSFAGKTVRLIVFLTLIIGITAGVFVFFLYYESLDYAYKTNTWQDARIITQSLDLYELSDLAESVSTVYDTLSEEDLHDHEKKHLNKYHSVYSPSYNEQLKMLRDAWKASDDEAVFIAFIDAEHNRMVYLMDADDTENQCPPGYWDDCDPDVTEVLLGETDTNWSDTLFDEGKIPAVTQKTEKYGFRVSAAEKLFSIGKYPVFVFCEQDMDDAVRTSIWFIVQYALLITIVMVIVLIVTIWRTKKRTVIPINEMAAAASEYAKDNREGRHGTPHFANLNIRTGDEIEVLSIAMKDMERDLADYVQNLTKVTREKERVNTELALANKIQAAMLPSDFPPFPDRKEFDIYASMTPEKEVGGDFYDFFFLDRDHLAIVMADVSGKGIPAAMFMMLTKNMIQTRMMTGGTPSQVLADVNELICNNNRENMFVTV
ncbi:MAG: SpoIIE family protein phosphatase, partial [Eubacterium sp.]|nr:SpoIIE family protein phosphatase [Eubacterium sp.]